VSKTPEPKWTSIQKEGDIEIREYDPMIVAEVTTKGERYDAINTGFRILAKYIFGGNEGAKELAMTVPVIQQSKADKGKSIAMTAPVIQQATDKSDEWKVSFVMPSEYSLDTLPVPNDKQIKFITIPKHQKATIRFSGFNSNDNLKANKNLLMSWILKHHIKTTSEPVFAFYNPPWTPFFMKRNEVMVDIEDFKQK